jgi:chromosome segregation ATPase
MAKGRYSLPSATERELRQRLGHSELRCSRLLKDSSGADEIAALDKQVAELEAELAAKDGQINTLKSRHGNLSEKNKNLRCDNAALRKEASRLRADVKVAHCLYAELERKCAVAEKKRFEWAQLARDLGSKLKAANAKVSKLTARLNKSPANSSLPPSLSPNTKLVCAQFQGKYRP